MSKRKIIQSTLGPVHPSTKNSYLTHTSSSSSSSFVFVIGLLREQNPLTRTITTPRVVPRRATGEVQPKGVNGEFTGIYKLMWNMIRYNPCVKTLTKLREFPSVNTYTNTNGSVSYPDYLEIFGFRVNMFLF